MVFKSCRGRRYPVSGPLSNAEAIKNSYAFLVADEIVRIGSSKAPLKSRMGSWRRDVSGALAGRRTSTPLSEAAEWRSLLADREGLIYARQGTEVTTQVGTFNAYMAEESFLIGLHRPRQNRSMHR